MAQVSTTHPGSTATGTRRADPSVLVVLVVRDGQPWLRECLRALGRQTYPRVGVVAVDNGSRDGSDEVLRRALGKERVITLPKNPGLPGSVQAALRLEAAARADYLLILHDDAALEPDAVARLVEAAERIEGVGVVGPKVVDWDDPRILRDVGSSTDRFGYPYSPLEEDELDQGQYDRVREVLFVSSSAMLVSRPALQRVGPPDERLATSHDDLDLCWRMRLAGFRVLMAPSALARHRAATVRGERPGELATRGRYHLERATLAALLKNAGLLSLLWLFPMYLVQGFGKVVLWTFSRRFEDVWQLVSAWGWNLLHLPGTIRRRVRAQAVRTAPDRAVGRYMAPLTVRMRRWVDVGRDVLGRGAEHDDSDRPLEEQEELELPSMGARTISAARAHPVLAAWIAFVAVAVFAYRHVVGPGPVEGGVMAAFPHAPSDYFHELLSGVRTTGLGGTDAASPALAVLGALAGVLFGSGELAQKALLILLPPLAALLFYRAALRMTARRVPSVLAAASYGLSALLMWSFSEGRIPQLVLLAALPPLASRLHAGFAALAPPRRARFGVELALILAAAAAFLPGALLAFAVLVLAHLVVPEGGRAPLRGLAIAAGAVAGAAALLFPFAVGLAATGGTAFGSSAGVADFASLVRLAPDGGPGSWSVSWFLPVAALLGFTLVERSGRRASLRFLLAAVAGVYLAWLSAAGFLPAELANAPAYLAVSAVSYAVLVALGVGSMSGIGGRAFGYRHLAAVAVGALLAGGLALHAALAMSAGWEIRRDTLPPAWPVVARSEAGAFRVLWLGGTEGEPLPAPGGDTTGRVAAGGSVLTYAVTGRHGVSALDYGRGADGPGYGYVERSLAEVLTGDTSHAGAMLGVASIRFVVAAQGALPDAVLDRLDQQLDLDLVPAGGLTIFRNERALPEAAILSAPGLGAAVDGGSSAAVAALPAPAVVPMRRVPGGYAATLAGPTGAAADRRAVLAQQRSGDWRVVTTGPRARLAAAPAYGWATASPPLPDQATQVRFELAGQWRRTAETLGLLALWLAALWVTRKPAARRGGAHQR
jgi:GT2 family glycosyltransferase